VPYLSIQNDRKNNLRLGTMTTSLDHLKQTGTIVVSDSGDFNCTSTSLTAFVSISSRCLTVVLSSPSSHRCLQTPGAQSKMMCLKCSHFRRLTVLLQDATTNPSLILAAANKPGYARLIDAAVQAAKKHGGSIDEQASTALDRLVTFVFLVLHLLCVSILRLPPS
jgi:hypothetical protein